MAIGIVGGPLVYQIVHPWHWLTYGQNASAIGLIVLVFYTIYTRRMMLLAQQTRRGELYPNLILQRATEQVGGSELVLMNVGGGPLLNASHWGMPVSSKFALKSTYFERPPEVQSSFAGSMVPKATLTLNISISGLELRTLQVVEGTDLVGGRHQLCILRRLVGPGQYSNQVHMAHPVDFLPIWQRLPIKTLEWKARLLRTPKTKSVS